MTTQSDTPWTSGIRWWRVIGGGLLIELVLTAASVPFFATGRPEMVSLVIVPATLVAAVPCGAWAARGTAQPILNGTLAGVAALALYLLLVIGSILAAPEQVDLTATLSLPYLASHACKVLGAAAGGWWIASRRARKTGS